MTDQAHKYRLVCLIVVVASVFGALGVRHLNIFLRQIQMAAIASVADPLPDCRMVVNCPLALRAMRMV